MRVSLPTISHTYGAIKSLWGATINFKCISIISESKPDESHPSG